MTREEEIKKASGELFNSAPCSKTYKMGFEAGAMWADNNPKSPWISVKDSLPKQDEEVIALLDELNTSYFYKISFAHIVDKTVCKDYNGWNVPGVVCWFPMPKIPKTGD